MFYITPPHVSHACRGFFSGLAKTEGPSSGKGEREGGKEEQERINENERPVANSSPAGCSSPSGLGEALRKECDGNYVMFTAVKRGQDGVMERGEGDEVKGGVRDEREKTPIPPPRRKRKKKLQKNPSLEDLEVHCIVNMSQLVIHSIQ